MAIQRKQRALKMALKFILKNITTKVRLNDTYLLNPTTISKIESGVALRKDATERYFEVFVDLIDSYRCKHDDESCEHGMAKAVLFDMFMLSLNKETEAERKIKRLVPKN